jgi:hypothetical protein
VKRALVASVTVVALLLVGACGSDQYTTSGGNSEPFTVETRHTNDLTYNVYTACIKGDKVFITSTGLAVIHNHEECDK